MDESTASEVPALPHYVKCPCRNCGGSIEFDGTSLATADNTARNIELLCEDCSRAKSDLIQ